MNHKLSIHLVFALAVGSLLVMARSAEAKPESRSVREKAAKKACAMGDYQKGADILTDLLLETDDPMHIYNQARCYEQNSVWDRAISRFREYLRKAKNLPDRERAETEQHIAECEAALARTQPPVTPPSPEPPVKANVPAPVIAPQPEPSTPVESAPAPLPLSDDSSGKGRSGRGLRIAGVITGAFGLAAIGAGVGFALKTQSISSNEDKNGATQAQENERKRYETWGWVSYGVGAAALATGVILYIVGWPQDEPSKVALLPSLSSNGASLSLGGRF
jgi:hypothetical protein